MIASTLSAACMRTPAVALCQELLKDHLVRLDMGSRPPPAGAMARVRRRSEASPAKLIGLVKRIGCKSQPRDFLLRLLADRGGRWPLLKGRLGMGLAGFFTPFPSARGAA